MRKFYPPAISILRNLSLYGVFLLSVQFVRAQTTLTTLPNPPYNGTNGAGTNTAVTFVVENTNAFPILLTNVGTWINSTDAAGTYQLWYSSSSLSGAPTIASPTWTQIAQATNFPAPATSGITNVFPGLSFNIPAATQYRFAVWYVTTASHYSGTGAGTVSPSTFTGGGVNLKLGDVQIGGQYVGYGGPNNPRWFTGTISFQPAGPCTSPPVAGTVATGSNPVCSGAPFSLNLTGGTGGTGQTYQWQSSPDGTSWTNVAGGTTAVLNASQSSNTYYRCYVTCGGLTDTSTSLLVTTTICYCTSIPTSAIDEEIFSVTVNGSTNAYGCTTVAPGAGSILNRYSNFYPLGALTTLIPGTTIPFTIMEDECDGPTYYNNGCAVWIDFNQNGSFADPGEQVYVENVLSQSPRTITGSFMVPVNASPGITGMRIIVAENYSGTGLQPCMSYTYGETEDYLVNIGSSTPCSGTPNAGVATSSAANVCSGQNFNLSLTGSTLAAGLTYQWQNSPDSVNWTNIPGATNFALTTNETATTYYRSMVTCTNGGASAPSAGVKVTLLASAPVPTITSSPSDTVCAGTAVTLSTATCTGCSYAWNTGANTSSISVNTSSIYTVAVTNACGVGSASKEIVYNPSPSLSINGTNSICQGSSTTLVASGANSYTWSPATGLNTTTGPTVIATPATTTTYTVTGSIGSCTQTMSVTVTVNPVPSTPTVTASGSTTFCQGGSVTFTSSATSGNQWYKDGNAIAGATNQTYAATAAGSYTVRVISSGCSSNASTAQAVTVNNAPPQPTITQVGNTMQSSAATGNQWFLNGTAITGATAQTYTTTVAGLYSVQVTANGCASPMSTAFIFSVTGVISPVLDAKIRIAPNPVRDKLLIRYNGNPARFTAMLISATGELLAKGTFTTNYEFDVRSFSSGVYIVRIVNDKTGEKTQRLVVKQ